MLADFVRLIVLVVMTLMPPQTKRCELGFTLHEGVRRDGNYACWGKLLPVGCGEPEDHPIPCKRPEITRSRIYCTGGSVPVIVNERTVSCQASH